MMFRCITPAVAAGFLLMSAAHAATISTEFNTSDGFVTGDTTPITLSKGAFDVTFSGGQQQQSFDFPSYSTNPSAYLFINGAFTGSFGGTVSGDGVDDDSGLIDFNIGVTEVSFFAANRGFGAGVTLNIFAEDDVTLLDTISITQTSNQIGDGAVETMIAAALVGGLIGSIGIDLPGPAGNPPYVLAIDSFSATAVPLPAALPLFLAGLAGVGFFQRRRRQS